MHSSKCPLTKEECEGLSKEKTQTPNPMPIVSIEDLNNRNERDIKDCNPAKRSLFIGLKWTF